MEDNTPQLPNEVWSPTPATQPKRRFGWQWVVALVAVILTCSCCMLVNGLHGGATTTSTQTATTKLAQTATTAPTKAPTVKPTANPNAGALTYVTTMKKHLDTLTTDMKTISDDCGAGDIDACDIWLQTLREDIQSAEHDRVAHPAPPCLKDVDANLHTAFSNLDKGAKLALDGIDQNDPSLIQEGIPYISQASTNFSAATAAMNAAHC